MGAGQWEQTETYPDLGGISEDGVLLRIPADKQRGITIRMQNILTVSGKKARLQRETLQYSEARYLKGNAAFDGKLTRSLGVLGAERRVQGSQSDQPIPVMDFVEYVPVYAAIGRIERVTWIGTFPAPDHVKSALVQRDGRELLQSEFTTMDREHTCMLWLDPRQHLAIVRIEQWRIGEEKPSRVITISHGDSDVIVKPISWTSTTHSSLRTSEVSGVIKSFEVNPNVADSEFQVVFPPGTTVSVMPDRRIMTVDESGALQPRSRKPSP